MQMIKICCYGGSRLRVLGQKFHLLVRVRVHLADVGDANLTSGMRPVYDQFLHMLNAARFGCFTQTIF